MHSANIFITLFTCSCIISHFIHGTGSRSALDISSPSSDNFPQIFLLILIIIKDLTLCQNLLSIKGVNPCSNMGGIILGGNIHLACGMYCASRRALLGEFGGMLPREIFFKWCNLVPSGVCLGQILSLKNFKNYYFFYIKI